MSADSEHSEQGDDLAVLRQAWRSMPADDQAKSLVALHQRYSAMFLSDNARIWTTAATMIPLSLGSFVVLASISHPSLPQIIIFSAAAWILMSVWLVIAENHRAFQEGSQRVLREIEDIWDFPAREEKSNRTWLASTGRVRQMRFVLWWTVTAGALLVILFWPGGAVNR